VTARRASSADGILKLRAPRRRGATLPGTVLDIHSERLQTAQSVDEIVRRVHDGLSTAPGVGSGAIFLVEAHGELVRAGAIEGPDGKLSVPEIELLGVARRAMREGGTVRQDGSCAGPLWAVALESPRGIEAVVTAVGEPGEAPRFLAHAGLALFRERRRAAETGRIEEAETRASALERAMDVLQELVREGGSETVVRRVAGAVAGIPGLARTALWTLRPEDGVYVETVSPKRTRSAGDVADRLTVPDNAHRAEAFREWAATLPRWGGFAWIPHGPLHCLRPTAGDTLL
jgi:hypothetical protein